MVHGAVGCAVTFQCTTWRAFGVACELLSQEQVFGGELRVGSERQSKQPKRVGEQGESSSDHVRQSYRPGALALDVRPTLADQILAEDTGLSLGSPPAGALASEFLSLMSEIAVDRARRQGLAFVSYHVPLWDFN
jgi:hypothetical protein